MMNFQLKRSMALSGCFGCLGVLGLALALTGGSSLPIPGTQPTTQANPLQLTNVTSGPVMSSVLQAQIMRAADTYVAVVAQGCDDISTGTTNPAVRLAVLR